METFHPSDLLAHGAKFRDTLRYKPGFIGNATTRLDHAHAILEDALKKHGDEVLSRENFKAVMAHAHADHRWGRLGNGGSTLEEHLRDHLGAR